VKVRLIKGIVTGEDAPLRWTMRRRHRRVQPRRRNEETLRATIDCLPEVVAA